MWFNQMSWKKFSSLLRCLNTSRNNKRRLIRLYTPPSNQYKFSMAATMRNNPTAAEKQMWEILTREVTPKFPKHQFKQQQLVFGYILDFYCPTLDICIEMDGGVHEDRRGYDSYRDKKLRRNGITVFHFQNEEVFKTPLKLADRICQCIEAKTTS